MSWPPSPISMLLSRHTRRREFAGGLVGAVAWQIAARGQQTPVIGFLSARSPGETAAVLAEFHKGLAEAGYVDGQTISIEYRWAEGRYDRLPGLAAGLVGRRVEAIAVTGGNVSALAVKAATSTIPIVFVAGGDPVKLGLVTSLNQPGGNITGVTLLITELGAKRLELLRELLPKVARIAILVNPDNFASVAEARETEARATSLSLDVQVLNAVAESDFESVFATILARKIEAMLVANDPILIDLRDRIVRMAAKDALPVVYFTRDFVDAGGLMSYGASIGEGYHKAGLLTGRILKGEKPAGLPVQRLTKVEMIINLKTAKALGLALPQSLLARADEVIE